MGLKEGGQRKNEWAHDFDKKRCKTQQTKNRSKTKNQFSTRANVLPWLASVRFWGAKPHASSVFEIATRPLSPRSLVQHTSMRDAWAGKKRDQRLSDGQYKQIHALGNVLHVSLTFPIPAQPRNHNESTASKIKRWRGQEKNDLKYKARRRANKIKNTIQAHGRPAR